RPTTTIAPQALLLMNDQVIRACAENFARRLRRDGRCDEDRVRQGFAIALGRAPSSIEVAESVSMVRAQEASYQVAGRSDARSRAWTDFCQVLLGLNEFIYVD